MINGSKTHVGFLEWMLATCDWRISSGAWKGKRYTLDTFPCQQEILQDESLEQVVMKSAQLAVSEVFTLARPFWALDQLGANWGIMFPSQGAMRDFFKTRLKAATAQNSYIGARTKAENESNVDAFERTLFLRYTSTETAIATFDADGVTVDEQDLHNPNNLYGAKTSRMQGAMSDIRWYEISTPTYPMHGIDASYANSDQKVWMIKCGGGKHSIGCGHENVLSENLGPFPFTEAPEFFKRYLNESDYPRWEDFHIPCSKCGKPIDPVTPMSAGGPGRWVARFADRPISGYHLQMLQRLYDGGTAAVLARMRKSLLDAKRPEHVRRWWNFSLGVPYEATEGRLTDEDIERATTHRYDELFVRHPVFSTVFTLEKQHIDWMGVDVRGQQYHIWGITRMSSEDFLTTLVGWVSSSADLRLLWETLNRPSFLIDAEPDINENRVLVNSMHKRAWRVKFQTGMNALWTKSGGDSRFLIVNRPSIMETTKAQIESRHWMVPAPMWDVGAGIIKSKGTEKIEETAKAHFQAPVLIRVSSDDDTNDKFDFPKAAMRGIDPHFFMAACLADLGTLIQAAPARAIGIPR